MRFRLALACALMLGERAAAEPADVVPVVRALAGYRYGDSVAVTRSVAGLVRESYGDADFRSRLVRELTGLIVGEATPDARRYALEQLALIGTAAEAPAIAALMSDTEYAESARAALERNPGPEARAALAAAPATVSGAELDRIRGDAATRTRTDARTLTEILAALADPDAEVAAASLRAVREMPGPLSSDLLRTRLAQLAPGDQVLLLAALSRRRDSAGRSAAVAAARSDDGEVRLAGLRALGRLGDDSTILFLARASASLTGESRDAARKSLDALRGETVDEAMAALVTPATFAGVRAEVIRSLAARGAGSGASAIEAMTKDADRAVRLAAAKALGLLARERSRATLISLIRRESDDEVRDAAAESLADVAKVSGGKAAGPVLAALDGSSPAARRVLLSVLPALGGAPALAAARRDLAHGDAEVAEAAIRALGEWPDPGPAPDLLTIARNDADPARRILALRGYVRLAGLPAKRPSAETVTMFASILAAAPRPEEVKLVLAGVAQVADPGALALAQSRLADPAVRDEAASAVVSIALAIRDTNPEEAAAAVGQALSAGTAGKTGERAKKLLGDLEKAAEFVTAWEVSGPCREEGIDDKLLLDHVFAPETAPEAATWEVPARDPKSETPWQVDLQYALGGEHCVAYLRTYLRLPGRAKVRFEIGSDDGVKVWVGGKEVHANNASRPVQDGEDSVTVELEAGWTPVLLKLAQGRGGWGASLRVRTPGGKRVEGLWSKTSAVGDAIK